ncbi:MAG TPA: response regulator, partial [Acidobacteria bacterium]|nr:response regulator [Acidobacteriota bacterium]
MIRVLIADDSATARQLLRTLIELDPDLELAGEARDGEEAVRLALELEPDVITMDLMMPRISGFDAIRAIRAAGGPPVIVVSSALDPEDGERTFSALELGAVSVQAKPHGLPDRDPRAAALLAELEAVGGEGKPRPGVVPPVPTAVERRDQQRVQAVGIAASTGGPLALLELLRSLGRHVPVPILVVQHITPGFLEGMAAWLERSSGVPVMLASDGMRASPGIFMAPDGHHLLLGRRGVLRLEGGSPGELHRPSADRLFRSMAETAGAGGVGVILTGMGNDGAAGLAELHRRGGLVLAQDRESSVVWGMPGAAVAAGAVDEVLPIASLGMRLRQILTPGGGTAGGKGGKDHGG